MSSKSFARCNAARKKSPHGSVSRSARSGPAARNPNLPMSCGAANRGAALTSGAPPHRRHHQPPLEYPPQPQRHDAIGRAFQHHNRRRFLRHHSLQRQARHRDSARPGHHPDTLRLARHQPKTRRSNHPAQLRAAAPARTTSTCASVKSGALATRKGRAERHPTDTTEEPEELPPAPRSRYQHAAASSDKVRRQATATT